jgi:hypothetical protein
MSTSNCFDLSRTYRFSNELAKKLKKAANSLSISESSLVRIMLEAGLETLELES